MFSFVGLIDLLMPTLHVAAQNQPSAAMALKTDAVAVIPFAGITKIRFDDWIGVGISETVITDFTKRRRCVGDRSRVGGRLSPRARLPVSENGLRLAPEPLLMLR